jgi:F420-non-reducing hydrogenase small subunit
VTQSAVATLHSGELPPKGTVLAPDKALCEECPRRESKPLDLSISEFSRPHEILIDEEMCLLAQGLVCLGPATRAGCGAACVSGNMPCSGCSGPTSRVLDHGGKAISGIASLIGADDEEGIDRILEGIPDPVGTFYRYGLPASLLRRKTLS